MFGKKIVPVSYRETLEENVEKIKSELETKEEFPVSRKALRVKKSPMQQIKFMDYKAQAKQRFEISKMIHRKKFMSVPGAPITPGVMHYNAMLPMIVEGLLQENLTKIQGFS